MRAMQAHVEGGLSAAEAARLVSAGESAASGVEQGDAIQRGVGELREALDAMDADAAHAVLDGLVASFTLETVLAGVVLPYLRELGERWQRARPPSPRSTSPATCFARAYSHWPVAGSAGRAASPCWPARRESSTTSR